jgi:hypothetical protein
MGRGRGAGATLRIYGDEVALAVALGWVEVVPRRVVAERVASPGSALRSVVSTIARGSLRASVGAVAGASKGR